MRSIRTRLKGVAAAWLLCHVLALLAPPVFAHAARDDVDEHSLTTCTCPEGRPDQPCPMHHPESKRPANGSDCLMRSAPDSAAAVLLSLSFAIGVPPAAAPADPGGPQERVETVPEALVESITLADSPPPRA